MPRLRSVTGTTLLAALALTAITAGGCTYLSPGNPMSSKNEFNYPSTSTLPQTVMLRDLRTDEVVRTWEVPVGMKLFVRFFPDRDSVPRNEANPDTCEWVYYPIGRWNPPLADRVRFNVPPADSRRLDLFVRSNPELPPSMMPAEVPMPPDDLPPIK
ncbi:MAG TPA: hypothetical protein VFF65_00765 [Phycisphaerales bacterium]|nr:hypothetical protein [Phycisphaerales bacterium]